MNPGYLKNFRRGRGVDDVLQVTRRILEEGTAARPNETVMLIRLFDTEKAYPRVSIETAFGNSCKRKAPQHHVFRGVYSSA